MRRLVVVLAVGLLAVGCSSTEDTSWDAAAHPDYRLDYDLHRTSREGQVHVTFWVRGGEVVAGLSEEPGTKAMISTSDYPGLGEIVELAEAADGDVAYEPELGYPVAVDSPDGPITNVTVTFDIDEALRDLTKARARWEQNNTEAYRLTYSQSTGTFAGEVVVEVEGDVANLVSTEGHGSIMSVKTIDVFFEMIDTYLSGRVLTFTFEYAADGHPTTVVAQTSRGPQGYGYRNITVEPLTPTP